MSETGGLLIIGGIVVVGAAAAYYWCSKNMCDCVALTGGHCDPPPPGEEDKDKDKDTKVPPPKETPLRKCYPSFDKTKVNTDKNPTTCWRDYPCSSNPLQAPPNKSLAICQLTCDRAKAAWTKKYGCKSARAYYPYEVRLPTVA